MSNPLEISSIGNKSLLVKADIQEARIISELDTNYISCIDIVDGPSLSIGQFLHGYGCIASISALKLNPNEPILLKIQLL